MKDSHGIAGATADVLLSVDGLTDDQLQTVIAAFHRLHEIEQGNRNGAYAEIAHSVVRLACAIRDKRSDEWKAFRRSYRHPRGVEPTRETAMIHQK